MQHGDVPTPSGTFVAMDKFASGADGEENYAHYVYGAADEETATYTLCFEVGIGSKDAKDLPSCSNDGDDEDVRENEEGEWEEEVVVDEEGLNSEDIGYVVAQVECSRGRAALALRANDCNVKDAVMSFLPLCSNDGEDEDGGEDG